LVALSDKHMSKILQSTSICERSVATIIKEQDIPYSTVYRKIKQLLKFGLLAIYKWEIIDGKKISYYKSTFCSFQINYDGTTQYKIEAITNPDVLERISARFYDL
jgi:hypothetical protein